MKALTLLIYVGFLFSQTSADDNLPKFTEKKETGQSFLTCSPEKREIPVRHDEDRNEVEICTKDDNTVRVLIRVRTCDNCIVADVPTILAVAGGSVLMTIGIGAAVYSLTTQAQPRARSFSGNKASDKVNLIQSNGEGDMYQSLNPGQKSEYQVLGGNRKRP